MAYGKLIGRAIGQAFKAAKDLAVSATVTPPASTSYDFSSDSAGTGTPVPCRVIRLATERKGREAENPANSALVELDRQLTTADVLTFEGKNWRVTRVVSSFRSVHLVELRGTS